MMRCGGSRFPAHSFGVHCWGWAWLVAAALTGPSEVILASSPASTSASVQGEPSSPAKTGPASAAGDHAPAAARTRSDPRPVVRLAVKNTFNAEDTVFPQVVEGRLISDLGDMETFRMVGIGAPGDYVLTCTIRTLDLESGVGYTTSRDAESNGTPQGHDQITVTMNLDLALEAGGKQIHRGSLSVQASRDFEISTEHTVSLLSQELIDRAAQRIEKMLRKKIPKS